MASHIFIAQSVLLNLAVKSKKIYTAAPKKGITVQACTHLCMYIHIHRHKKIQPTNTNFIVRQLLNFNC